MSRIVPAVSETTIRKTCGASKCSMTGWPALALNERNRKT